MSSELADVMKAGVDQGTRAFAGREMATDQLRRVAGRVHRRRVVRHSAQAGVAVVASAGVAAGGWFGLHRGEEPVPPATPTPTVTTPAPTPAPAPSATPSATPTAEPIVQTGFPTALPLPDGLLEQTGPGWVLTMHRPQYVAGGAEHVVGQAIFLVSPTGETYRVLDLPVDRFLVLFGWTAGSSTADVRFGTRDADGRLTTETQDGQLDLRTGALTPGGIDLPFSPSGASVLDPTGTRWLRDAGTQYELMDVATRESVFGTVLTPDHQECDPVGWLDAGHALFLCLDPRGDDSDLGTDGRHPRLYVHDVRSAGTATQMSAGTFVADVTPDDPTPSYWVSGLRVSDGVVAFTSFSGASAAGCPDGVGLWDGHELRMLQAPDPDRIEDLFDVRVHEGLVYVESTGGCRNDRVPRALTVHDLAAGTMTTLVAPPTDGGDESWVQGMTSWATAGPAERVLTNYLD